MGSPINGNQWESMGINGVNESRVGSSAPNVLGKLLGPAPSLLAPAKLGAASELIANPILDRALPNE